MAGLRIQVKVSETRQSPFSVRIDAGGHALTGDEPVEAGGCGFGPNSFELLTSVLAECTVMTVRWPAPVTAGLAHPDPAAPGTACGGCHKAAPYYLGG